MSGSTRASGIALALLTAVLSVTAGCGSTPSATPGCPAGPERPHRTGLSTTGANTSRINRPDPGTGELWAMGGADDE